MRRIAIVLAFSQLLATGHHLLGQELKECAGVKGHPLVTDRVALSPDGKLLATGGKTGRDVQVIVWEVASGKEVATFAFPSHSVEALTFSPDSRLVAAAVADLAVVWDVATRKQEFTHKGYIGPISVLAFSGDGKKLGAYGGGQVRLWDVTSGKELSAFERPIDRGGAAFSGDLRTLACPNIQEIDLWDVDAGKLRETLPERPGQVACVAFDPDGKTLAVATAPYGRSKARTGDLRLWDVATGRERAVFRGAIGPHVSVVETVRLSPDGRTVAVLHNTPFYGELALTFLDVRSGRRSSVRHPPGYSFTSVAFTSDGRLFATGTPDEKAVKLWEVSIPKREGG
jgi:WD40 repeat protein